MRKTGNFKCQVCNFENWKKDIALGVLCSECESEQKHFVKECYARNQEFEKKDHDPDGKASPNL